MKLRRRIYMQLDPKVWTEEGMSPLNVGILIAVLVSIIVVILQSEPEIFSAYPSVFISLNWVFGVFCSIEYIVRLWAMGEAHEYSGFKGRLRYAGTFASVLDLVATISIWIDLLFGIPGVYGLICRMARALRVLTLSRNSKAGVALRLLLVAVVDRSTELMLSFMLTLTVMLVTATALFIIEGQAQPDAFGSIPRSMWWALATLTTVGYGDTYPITAAGKVFAGIATLTSIAIVAMPTGILAAAFSDAFQKLRKP
ncbi:MAG: ion transporter [Hyphomicrobiales bacterium]